MKKKGIIYARVSAIQQSYESQVAELRKRAKHLNLEIVDEIAEKITGKEVMDKRAGIIQLRKLIKEHKITTVVFSDVSRIGRNLFESRKLVNELTNAGINCHIRDINIDTLDPDGNVSAFKDLIMNLLMSIYEYQRADIVAKVRVGKAHSKIKQGRKVGSVKSNKQLLKDHENIVQHLKSGLKIRNIAELCNCSKSTVMKVKQVMGLVLPKAA